MKNVLLRCGQTRKWIWFRLSSSCRFRQLVLTQVLRHSSWSTPRRSVDSSPRQLATIIWKRQPRLSLFDQKSVTSKTSSVHPSSTSRISAFQHEPAVFNEYFSLYNYCFMENCSAKLQRFIVDIRELQMRQTQSWLTSTKKKFSLPCRRELSLFVCNLQLLNRLSWKHVIWRIQKLSAEISLCRTSA